MTSQKLDWTRLRVWKTSQEDAFEELCCQLAHAENVPVGASFVRNASPDAGVECLWRLPSGEEWGWQAKFPHAGLSKSLWAQLDKSVRTAIPKRPQLTRYYVCLPLLLPDPKLTKCKSARQKWDAWVARWKRLAGKRKHRLEFILWDDHEIWHRLSREEHRGRRAFWFGKTVFTGDWFRNHLKATLDQARDRYDALLNIKVPEAGLFPALARTTALWTRLDEWALHLRQAIPSIRRYEGEEQLGSEVEALRKSLGECLEAINGLSRDESTALDFPTVANRLAAAADACSAVDRKRAEVESETTRKLGQTGGQHPGAPGHGGRGFSWHTVREIHRRIDHATEFLASKSAKVINTPVLLVTGEAGSGKTHLLCGIAETLTTGGVPVILLLGEQFHDAEPWGQILTNLGLGAERDEFLGALDAAAEAARTRALIIIDALNEGDGLRVWPRHLSAFIRQVRHWSRISLCLSLRSGYEGTVLPPGLDPDCCIRVAHRGFANLELEAASRFFEHFAIATPSIPVLTPEFANPLFLKLFCCALRNAGLKEVPTGLHGITEVFDFFLETINAKLSKPTALDFDPASRLVQKAVDCLAELMVQKRSAHLPLEQVKAELDLLLPGRGYEKSLERQLFSEGVLTRQPDSGSGGKNGAETVRFTYQRFADHRIVHIVLRGVKVGQERAIFTKGAPLWALVESAAGFGQGIWDALAIQLPEFASAELPDVLPRSTNCGILRDAFLASVLWRKRAALGARTEYWIEYYQTLSDESYAKTMDMLLGVSTCTGHRFNADFLHQYLVNQPMPDRDATWSIFLFQECGEGRSLDRLIDWAFSEKGHAHFDDETARLSAIALAWFLSTSHRFVRDRATKALVSLLEKRIPVLCGILRQFAEVDDVYVLERLYAAALGCALCTENTNDLQVLAQQVYDVVFKAGSPPAHMTLRDYAKSVVQAAFARGIRLDCEVSRVIPPYRTKWIGRLPTLKALKHRLDENVSNEECRGGRRLYCSVTADDFCFYEMSDLGLWTPRRLGARTRPSPTQIYDSFERSLSEQQRLLLLRYEQKSTSQEAMKLIYGGWTDDLPRDKDEDEKQVINCEQDLLRALGPSLGKRFRAKILPILRRGGRPSGEEHFGKELLQRWILHRALEMGWSKERFGLFDGRVDSKGRDAFKPERIGKKYQWIAREEFFARMSDNFEFATEPHSLSEDERESGKWTHHFRDIDPSLLIRSTPKETSIVNPQCWWANVFYEDWFCRTTKLAWLRSTSDLPNPSLLLEVVNPADGSRWFVLEGFTKWRREENLGNIGSEEPDQQELWYGFRSYFFLKRESQRILKWAAVQDWRRKEMPEVRSGRLRICLHEHYWPPHFDSPTSEDWVSELFPPQERLPGAILLANDVYMCEQGTYDCSVDDTIWMRLPCRWLVEKMNLTMKGRRGQFYDETGQLIAFDPSVLENGPGALLVHREALLEFLNADDFGLFWTFLGEKEIHKPNHMDRDHWFGRLEINGYNTINDGKVEGQFGACFQQGGLTKDEPV